MDPIWICFPVLLQQPCDSCNPIFLFNKWGECKFKILALMGLQAFIPCKILTYLARILLACSGGRVGKCFVRFAGHACSIATQQRRMLGSCGWCLQDIIQLVACGAAAADDASWHRLKRLHTTGVQGVMGMRNIGNIGDWPVLTSFWKYWRYNGESDHDDSGADAIKTQR